MRKPRRDRKQQKLDQKQHYDEMEQDKPDHRAVNAFRRKAYSVNRSESVVEYMEKKGHDVKKGLR